MNQVRPAFTTTKRVIRCSALHSCAIRSSQVASWLRHGPCCRRFLKANGKNKTGEKERYVRAQQAVVPGQDRYRHRRKPQDWPQCRREPCQARSASDLHLFTATEAMRRRLL